MASTEHQLYDTPAAIVLQLFIHSLRGEKERAHSLYAKFTSATTTDAFDDSDFDGVYQLAGRDAVTHVQRDEHATASAFRRANLLAGIWLESSGGGDDDAVPLELERVEYLFERAFIDMNVHDPERLSYLRVLEDVGFRKHNAYLSDGPSVEFSRQHVRVCRQLLRTLQHLESRGMIASDSEAFTSAEVLRWMLEDDVLDGSEFVLHHYVIEQLDGIHSTLLLFLSDFHELNDREDAENYVARLRAVDAKLARADRMIEQQAEAGVLPPRFALDKVLQSIETIVASGVEGCALSSTFVDKASAFAADLVPVVHTLVRTVVLPAYERLAACVRAVADKYATDDAGVWKLPHGERFYAHCLRHQTTTTMTPAEIHALGLRRVAAIHDAMRKVIVEQLGEPADTDPMVFMRRLNDAKTDERLFYADTPEQREQCLNDFRALVAESEALVAPLFDVRPKQPLVIKRVPSHMEPGAPAAFYYEPSLDGKRDGQFFVNLADMGAIQKYEMRTLTAHEGVPGHHFQLSIAVEQKTMPAFRRSPSGFTAYLEGCTLCARPNALSQVARSHSHTLNSRT